MLVIKLKSLSLFSVSLLLAVAVVVISSVPIYFAEAAVITSASDAMSSSKVSATSTHAISFRSPTGANENTDTIIVTFPADFNFTSKTIGSVSFTHGVTTGLENTETLAASPSATSWGAVFSGTQNRILTLTAPSDGVGAAAIAANNRLRINYDGTNSINPSSPATYQITIGGAFGDTGEISVQILTDDQIAITAVVPQSLTFSISDNTVSFGTLSASAARYASGTASGSTSEVEAHNLVVGTNAANGYTMSVSGNTLTAGAHTITAIGASNVASAIGTEQFGLRLVASGGTGSVSAPYAAAGFALDTAAFPDEVATASGATGNTTYSARYIANITSSSEAGSYGSTLTYTATANF